jgi:GMP synthase-like glutamine amidotransferase
MHRLPVTECWAVLQHVAWEGPGLIAAEARRKGRRLVVRRIDRGDLLPQALEVEGLVVMGGPMGVCEADRYPFLLQECRLIEDLVRRQKPVLGVCLGAQLLAHALGATVYAGHASEIGFGSVDLTSEGRRDPVLGPVGPSLPVFHWHGDTFTLPAGAVLLASSPDYPHQAFRYGDLAYGLQFHVEPNASIWSAWRKHLPDDHFAEAGPKRKRISEAGKAVMQNFFSAALPPRAFDSGC